MDTQWQLVLKARASHFECLNGPVAQLADELAHLARSAEQALQAGKKKSGPRMPIPVQRAVQELVTIYEEVTGKPLSHNPKDRTHYDGKPHSQAGRFILTFFEIVDSTVLHTSISTGIASIVRSRDVTKRAATG
jgi:hypothetical protein